MSDQTVLWIALPNGLNGTTPRVTVFVAPQLAPSSNALTPDFQVWPKTLAQLQPSLKIAFGGQAHDVTPAAGTEAPDADLWAQLFPPGAKVEPFAPKSFSSRLVRSYPARRVRQHLEGVYREIAETSPGSFPSIGDGSFLRTNLLDPLEPVTQQVEENEKRLETRLGHGTGKVRALRASDTPFGQEVTHRLQSDFFQLYRFYYRPKAREQYGPLDPAKVPPRPDRLAPDFHRTLALVADYPKLLRLLGLALDLEVPGVDLAGLSGPQTIQVTFGPGAAAPAGSIRPLTHYAVPKGRFVAAPRQGSLLKDGMLALDQADFFDLYQLDLDGASLKAVDLAANLKRLLKPENRNFETPAEASLPSLRSGGLSVSAVDRAARLVEHFDRNDQLAAAGLSEATELFADDLVRGFRLDVWDSADPKWRSLHERHGTYVVAAGAALPERTLERDDEGYVKGASPTSSPAEPDQDLYLHESLFGWDGWSLAAPRPGHVLRHDRDPAPGTTHDHVGDKDPDTATPLDASFRAKPGSLPRLRFGRRYRVRARAVDLAGNSLPLETAEDVLAVPPKKPAPQPQGTPYGRLEPVASPAILRRYPDTEGESLERIVIRSDVNTAPADYIQRPEVQAALAGKPYTYRAFSERHVVPPKTSQLLAELHGRFDDAFGPGAGAPTVNARYELAKREARTLLDVPGVTKGADDEALLDADGLTPPYLPDPIAAGVAFLALPGDPTSPRLHAWAGTWPDLAALRLRIEDKSGPPEPGPNLLTVHLPQAAVARVRYSSFFDEALLDTEVLGVWLLVTPAKRAQLAAGAATGQHWMLTPYRTIELVHAVQHPLAAPQLVKPLLGRGIGETFASFRTGTVSSDAKSTGRIDVVAQWIEPIDRPTDAKPDEHVAGQGHVCGFTLAPTENDAHLGPEDKPGTPPAPPQHRAVHEFGDTKHRVVQYRAVGTTRFREYFPPEITSNPDNITQAGDWVERPIPSSARPDAPAVVSVVPTFGWTETQLRNGVRRTRQGNALRVWLGRPWWSSGAGELLGVVLREPGPTPIPHGPPTDPLAPYVTQWGIDPLWTSELPQLPPSPANFPKAVASKASGLALEELARAGLTVGVAGHQPQFDEAIGLWYCDVEIAAGSSYFPFVRLALARYQPNSLGGVELSRVLLADFMQVVPDRTATVTFPAPTQAVVQVNGSVGLNQLSQESLVADPAPVPHLGLSRVVRAALQTRDPKVKSKDDPLGWVGVSQTTLPLTAKAGPVVTWQGPVSLPAGVRGKRTHRLLITESEIFKTDEDTKDRDVTTGFPPEATPVRERIVYADELVL